MNMDATGEQSVVVVGIGIAPATDTLAGSAIALDNGVLVTTRGSTGQVHNNKTSVWDMQLRWLLSISVPKSGSKQPSWKPSHR